MLNTEEHDEGRKNFNARHIESSSKNRLRAKLDESVDDDSEVEWRV